MAKDAETSKRRITIRRHVAAETMSPEQYAAVKRRLARLVAHAYAADHPGMFTTSTESANHESSGPPAAAAAVAGALPANAGGPDRESREHHDVQGRSSQADTGPAAST